MIRLTEEAGLCAQQPGLRRSGRADKSAIESMVAAWEAGRGGRHTDLPLAKVSLWHCL